MVVIVTSRMSARNIPLELDLNLVVDTTLDGMSKCYTVLIADYRHISCDIGYSALFQQSIGRARVALVLYIPLNGANGTGMNGFTLVEMTSKVERELYAK